MRADLSQRRRLTAIGRSSLSRPMALALEAGLLPPGVRVFDYGCGRGDDVRRLLEIGIEAEGWDPAHRPDGSKRPADVVNLGYVINVIEDPVERAEALTRAWNLATKVLVVSARLVFDTTFASAQTFGDGCLTGMGTFQKLYSQKELRDFIETTLERRSFTACPGVFFVFRDEGTEQSYIASRYVRTRAAPKVRKSDLLFEQHRPHLEALMAFLANRGRLPASWELPESPAIVDAFGSIRRAHALIRRVTGTDQWDALRVERYQELLVHLALSRFLGRPRFGSLPADLQLDIRDFFSNYKIACEQADRLLFSAGDTEAVSTAMHKSALGKFTGSALYVHVDWVHRLSPILRVYEGCAREYAGSIEGATLVKLHRAEPVVSYLGYPHFDSDPHPALEFSVVASLSSLDLDNRTYRDSPNPPILHRKETFLDPTDARVAKFARLTAQEEKQSLLSETTRIGTRLGWDELLHSKGFRLRGHQLYRAARPS